MKKLHCYLAVGVLVCSLTGCGLEQHPEYSENVQYGVRTDPIVRAEAKLGDEGFIPDRPGILPLMKFGDIKDPDSPMYVKRSTIDDTVLRDPTKISTKDRAEIEKTLKSLFGTPARPKINAKLAGIDAQTIEALKLDTKTLQDGSKYYRVHCMHCHGVPGDGRGPTARWINPHPRDFRAGMFKFQSVNQAGNAKGESPTQRPPSRADLLRTLRHGIEGTAMPSFALLSDRDLELLVSYVMHLSLRGTVELRLMTEFFMQGQDGHLVWNEDAANGETIAEVAVKIMPKLITSPVRKNGWKESNDAENQIQVEPYPYQDGDLEQLKQSVQRGQYLFLGDEKNHPRGKTANCKQCHDDYGRQARFKFDQWGTLVRPNNFTQGVFRGGRRPVDMYYRVHSGINGSGMTNFGSSTGLKGEDIWDLVNFVQTLSQPAMRDRLGIKID